jgi:hypothetical protein
MAINEKLQALRRESRLGFDPAMRRWADKFITEKFIDAVLSDLTPFSA